MRLFGHWEVRHLVALLVFCGAGEAPLLAQRQDTRNIRDMQIEQAARNADAGVGEIGQRQTREDVTTSSAPVLRLSNRVQNRVQNRLRNRIDRYYDPTANARSPFEVAGEEVRAAARRVRSR